MFCPNYHTENPPSYLINVFIEEYHLLLLPGFRPSLRLYSVGVFYCFYWFSFVFVLWFISLWHLFILFTFNCFNLSVLFLFKIDFFADKKT